MAKLTLSVDERVVDRAKRYAKQRGVSISSMVETYLEAVSEPSPGAASPILKSVRGVLRRGSLDDYREHLAAKYK